ncbi:MAG: hypothetical protein JXR12_06745 [Neptunomonas phycophila]|uniref:hypothetical protein n=1 Tax=Neptunomonas phycophila TaxID=1572645 RepID=UPI003B8CF58D
MFVVIEWENTSEATAKKMIEKIEEAKVEIIGANMGEMLCFTDHEEFEPLRVILTDIVHDFNLGAWCEVKEVTEESIQHLL